MYSSFTFPRKKSGEKWGNVGENVYLCKRIQYTCIYMRFLGKTDAKLDIKGRVFLPASFRKELQGSGADRLVLRKDVFNDCLVVYPESVWNEQMDALRRKLNRWNKAHQQVFRQFVSEAEMVQLDASGRLLIPKRCLQVANIEQDVQFVGMGDTIEIWAKQNTEQPFMDAELFGKSLEELMGGDDFEEPQTEGKEDGK